MYFDFDAALADDFWAKINGKSACTDLRLLGKNIL